MINPVVFMHKKYFTEMFTFYEVFITFTVNLETTFSISQCHFFKYESHTEEIVSEIKCSPKIIIPKMFYILLTFQFFSSAFSLKIYICVNLKNRKCLVIFDAIVFFKNSQHLIIFKEEQF